MLDSLHIQNYRLFKDLKIDKLGQVNLIAGKNNTGKTALLEAIILGYEYSPVAFSFILASRNEFDINGYTSLNLLFQNDDTTNPIKIQFDSIKGIRNSIIVYKDEANIREDSFYINFIPADKNDKPVLIKPISHSVSPYFSNVIYVPFYQLDKIISNLWSNISLTTREDELVELLQIIEPKILKIRIEDSKAKVLLKGSSEPIPLKRLGDGINRLLFIGLALINAKDKSLLIDEFEVGLHFRVQKQLWDIIFEYSKKWNIQIFVTTHSKDTIYAFYEIAQKEKYKNMGAYIKLNKVKDDIIALNIDFEDIGEAIISNSEIR